MLGLIDLLLHVPAILIATTLHEFIRAAVSTSLGDELPRNEKRLTLNPVKHFEPIGFILILATNGFGWGKPVNTSALYYKDRKRDVLLTAILPSVSNLVIAFLFAYLRVYVLRNFVQNITLYNNGMAFIYLEAFFQYTIWYNAALAVYNILPITPMDGLKVISQLVSHTAYVKLLQNEKIIQMMVLLFLFMNVLNNIFEPVIRAVVSLMPGF